MIPAHAAYKMLDNENLWETAVRCHEALADAGVAHAVVGGVAVCLHGYQRNTVDLDLLIDADDSEAVRDALLAIGFAWDDGTREFRTPTNIPIPFLRKGEKAGPDSDARFPDPADGKSATQIDGLPVRTLAKLIESKIACGEGNMRRTHKDFADVVELVAAHELSRSFARFLHKSVRKRYCELVQHARGSD